MEQFKMWSSQLEPLANPGQPALTEATLVAAAKADPAAFDEIYRRYLNPVYRYLRVRTASEEEAADMTQQVFLRALAALPRYQERGLPLAAWLFRIARNLIADMQRRRRETASWDLLPEALHPEAASNPERDFEQQERLTELGRLLAKLSQDKRELLALRFAGGLSAREIAGVVGKNEEAVKRQLSRILNQLREQYREYDHEV